MNSSGCHWKIALDGLRTIRADARAKILLEATALFGPGGPSEDHDTRHSQLADFSRKQDKSLDDLNNKYYYNKYYSCKENIKALLALYAIEHKEHFLEKK